MRKSLRFERGQALILIVLGIVGLIGLTALTIDGGNAYSDRRHAQNAADTAALAAARARIRDEAWQTAGLALAAENGYDNNGSTNTVEVYLCTDPAASCELVNGEDPSEYIQVIITSHVSTYFAPLLGIEQVTNRVSAIARAKPEYIDQDAFGDTMISLMDGCKGETGWPHDPFTISGNSTSVVCGSGVFVNSDCDDAFDQNGAATLTVDDPYGVCVIGGYDYAPGSIDPPPANCGIPKDYPPPIKWPNPTCDSAGQITEIGSSPRVYAASPGNYADFPDVSPSGKLIMNPGVYCLTGDFDLNSTWEITTDVNDNGVHDDNEGVLIYVENGEIRLNGTSDLDLHAMTSSAVPEPLRDLLFYLPLSNDSGVTINGSSGSTFTGSIWAPGSHISLEGNNTSYDLNTQLMGFTISISGTADIDICYNSGENSVVIIQPTIELTR